jgi:predicted transcriptional regulator
MQKIKKKLRKKLRQRKFILPQAIELYYLIPSLRKQLAIALMKRGLKQKEVARLLSLTPSAISQYLSGKRATNKIGALAGAIEKSAEKIESRVGKVGKIDRDKDYAHKELLRLIKIAERKGIMCELCKAHNKINCKDKICY